MTDRRDNSTRTKARKRALDVLYESELRASVELEITYTEPGLQGDRSSAGTKPATLETGKQIQAPLFLANGERVRVDTRDGGYLGRV